FSEPVQLHAATAELCAFRASYRKADHSKSVVESHSVHTSLLGGNGFGKSRCFPRDTSGVCWKISAVSKCRYSGNRGRKQLPLRVGTGSEPGRLGQLLQEGTSEHCKITSGHETSTARAWLRFLA